MEKKIYYKYEYISEDEFDFVVREKLLYNPSINCFTSKKEAKVHFKKAQETALTKYSKIINGIGKLKEELGNFEYDYFMLGDTYGIYSDGMFIEIEVDGYYFRFTQN